MTRLSKKISSITRRLKGVQKGAITVSEIVSLLEKPDPTILEIGAHDGSDTLRLLAAFPDGCHFAFEPDPRAASRWRDTVNDSRAALFQVAISKEDGEVQFFQSSGTAPDSSQRDWDYSGSIRAPTGHLEKHPWVKFETPIMVQTRALDSWAAEHGIEQIDFIWADVQGAESDLIQGGIQTLTNTRFLYTEYSDEELYEGQASLKDLMMMLGPDFQIAKRWDNDVLFRNRRLVE